MEYSYTLIDNRGNTINKGRLTEEHYNEVLKHENIMFIEEWETEYKESTLYGKRYRVKDSRATLFLWKEVFKVC